MPYSKDPESYPPECLELFRRGYEQPVRIQLASQAAATSLRHRLHAYRRALAYTNSPFVQLANSCVVRVENNCVVVEPSTIEIRKALAEAGVPFDSAKVTTAIQHEEELASDALDKVLREQGWDSNSDPNANNS
jgi:hypothetical protein